MKYIGSGMTGPNKEQRNWRDLFAGSNAIRNSIIFWAVPLLYACSSLKLTALISESHFALAYQEFLSKLFGFHTSLKVWEWVFPGMQVCAKLLVFTLALAIPRGQRMKMIGYSLLALAGLFVISEPLDALVGGDPTMPFHETLFRGGYFGVALTTFNGFGSLIFWLPIIACIDAGWYAWRSGKLGDAIEKNPVMARFIAVYGVILIVCSFIFFWILNTFVGLLSKLGGMFPHGDPLGQLIGEWGSVVYEVGAALWIVCLLLCALAIWLDIRNRWYTK